MSEPTIQPASAPPVSTFTGPVAELIAQRMLLPPSRPGLLAVVDHFEILHVLGGGGMGIVLRARDADTGRDVAIKMVRSDLVTNQQVVHRFIKEAGHLKQLRHTNIVPMLEISDRAAGPYFVMPYFEKGSLAGRIKPGQPLDTGTILSVATQLAEGLSFAHRSGIIHRDLKPANILLGENGQVCLADFGLARTVFNDTIVDVQNRPLEGTAPYMSPAVAAGDAEDTRCDIYSFGALLYEMLTGNPPYQGRSTKEILDQIIAGPPKSIASLQPGADRRLVAVAEKAMARELRNRYADMRDVLNDLQLISQGKSPVAQTGVDRSDRFLKYVLSVTGIAGAALLGWLFWLQQSAPTATAPTVTSTPAASAPIISTPVAAIPVAQPTPIAMPAPLPVPAPVPKATGSILIGEPGSAGYADGPGAQAQFRLPNNVAVDGAGNVYVADTANNAIRKISPDGIVSTLAGSPGNRGSTDGAGSTARFCAPFGIAVDASGAVYVADTVNNTIRKISPDGVVSTLAGAAGIAGSTDGVGAEARFRNPWGVAVDALGNVFVADMSNDTIRKISPGGKVVTLAGQAGESGTADGLGGGARFNNPFALAVDNADNVYVSDSGNDTIRKLTPGGYVVTLAGQAGSAGDTDANGSIARFRNPQGLAVDGAGNIYVTDAGNNLIRKITPARKVTTLEIPPGSADAAAKTGGNTHLNNPGGVALDAAGNIYVADTSNHCIRKLPLSQTSSPGL